MTPFELETFPTEVKPEVSGTSLPEIPGNPTQTAVSEPLFKCGEEAQAIGDTKNSSPLPLTWWTPARVERLEALWEAGVPTAEIGRDLETSKNAICGKARRLCLPRHPYLGTPYIPPHDVFNGGGCVWPYGDPGELGFHFCGHHELAVTESGRRLPYCEEHAGYAYRKPSEDQENAD